jgi:hypothetical protein
LFCLESSKRDISSLPPPAETHNRHCERSEAIHLTSKERMDCFVALLLAMTLRAELPFSPEQLFRKLYPIETQFSRTRFLAHATDERWVRLNPKTEIEN